MSHFVRVIMEKQETKKLDESVFPVYETYETELDTTVMEIPLPRALNEEEADEFANRFANYLFTEGYEDFDIEITGDDLEEADEITYDDVDEFHEDYGILWYNDDDIIDEAEYRGDPVKLGKPVRSSKGPKKFHVYVKNPKGNVVKVNFGDPNMKIKKSNPARRRSFRARHNCDNPGPRHKARYWSCRKW